jgi:hypothetical protein
MLRGIKQLTYGGKPDANGEYKDPTDKYTYIAAAATTPVLLGILGSATSSTGQVFGKIGITSNVVRVSSSVIYSVAGGVPGLSTLFRGFSKMASLFSCCRKPPVDDEESNLLHTKKSPSLNSGES